MVVCEAEVVRSPCPDCRQGALAEVCEDYEHTFAYENQSHSIRILRLPIIRCGHCGETSLGQAALQIVLDAEYYQLGLLLPREITAGRERLALSQRQFARLLGIGVATLSRWERGHLRQSRSMDNLLRIALADEGCRKRLESIRAQAEKAGREEYAAHLSHG